MRNELYSFDNTAFEAWKQENNYTLRVTRGAMFTAFLPELEASGQGNTPATAIADLGLGISGKFMSDTAGETVEVPSFTKTIKE